MAQNGNQDLNSGKWFFDRICETALIGAFLITFFQITDLRE